MASIVHTLSNWRYAVACIGFAESHDQISPCVHALQTAINSSGCLSHAATSRLQVV